MCWNLLLEGDAGQERSILLGRVSHENEIDIVKGPRLDQVDLPSHILLCRCPQNSDLASVQRVGFSVGLFLYLVYFV